jgi:hypothetical protein
MEKFCPLVHHTDISIVSLDNQINDLLEYLFEKQAMMKNIYQNMMDLLSNHPQSLLSLIVLISTQ